MVKSLGTVTDNTEFSFEFCVRERSELSHLPIQVLIYHTRLDGMKCVLADSKLVETTENKEEVI